MVLCVFRIGIEPPRGRLHLPYAERMRSLQRLARVSEPAMPVFWGRERSGRGSRPKPGGRALATAGAKRDVCAGKEKRKGIAERTEGEGGVAGGTPAGMGDGRQAGKRKARRIESVARAHGFAKVRKRAWLEAGKVLLPAKARAGIIGTGRNGITAVEIAVGMRTRPRTMKRRRRGNGSTRQRKGW